MTRNATFAMTEILVLLALLGAVGVGLWLTLVVLRRTVKWLIRIALATLLLLSLMVGLGFWFFWWNSSDAPRKKTNNRPTSTRPR